MKLSAVIELTRWKEHVFYVLPLTLLGALLGSADSGYAIDIKIVFLLAANILANAFAFMFNDIEDAEDDSRDKKKKQRNPISAGRLTREQGVTAAKIVLLMSALLYAISGFLPFVTGAMILILSHLYSWKSLRLKSLPLVDIISHVLMLGSLLLYAGFTVYSDNLTAIWLVGMAVALFSAYGQLYNQYRDYANDKLAGLKNTASLLSENILQRLMYLCVALGGITIIISVWKGLFPTWLVWPLILGIVAAFYKGPQTKITNIKSTGITTAMQNQSLIPLNIVVITWFIYEVFEVQILSIAEKIISNF